MSSKWINMSCEQTSRLLPDAAQRDLCVHILCLVGDEAAVGI